jgi:hypothetical protein
LNVRVDCKWAWRRWQASGAENLDRATAEAEAGAYIEAEEQMATIELLKVIASRPVI